MKKRALSCKEQQKKEREEEVNHSDRPRAQSQSSLSRSFEVPGYPFTGTKNNQVRHIVVKVMLHS